jgi:hypothetical protein
MGNSQHREALVDLTEDHIQMLLDNTSFSREEIIDWHNGFLVISFVFTLFIETRLS